MRGRTTSRCRGTEPGGGMDPVMDPPLPWALPFLAPGVSSLIRTTRGAEALLRSATRALGRHGGLLRVGGSLDNNVKYQMGGMTAEEWARERQRRLQGYQRTAEAVAQDKEMFATVQADVPDADAGGDGAAFAAAVAMPVTVATPEPVQGRPDRTSGLDDQRDSMLVAL